ncbi:MAG: leucine-rich repeat protein [Clostridiales bacterium]|nr:leucine-rich repeat protein [Clostridiales bacterium]
MTTFKRLLGVILSIILILSSVPILASAEETYYTSDDGYLTYYIKDGEAIINDCDTSISGDYTIPSTLGGYPVTAIGKGVFRGCTSLTSVTIPFGVTLIGQAAFCDCTSLTSITISNSVTSIGRYAFSDCTSLTSIDIPDSVRSIAFCAFQRCTSLKSVTIPDSVTAIIGSTFEYCKSLTSIDIPDSVTSIGDEAFFKCTSLESITIPDSVTSIGRCAFFDTSIASVTIPGSVTSIGEQAFGYHYSYTYKLIDGFAIYGYDGTAAETYANNEGITFVSLGEYVAPVQTTTSAVLDEDGSQSAGLAAEGESQTADGSGSTRTFGYILIAAVVLMIILAAAAVVIIVVVSKRKKPHYTGTYNQ